MEDRITKNDLLKIDEQNEAGCRLTSNLTFIFAHFQTTETWKNASNEVLLMNSLVLITTCRQDIWPLPCMSCAGDSNIVVF